MTKLFIDGGCSGNGQFELKKRKMISVVVNQKGKVISEVENIGGSNNIAELIALVEALKHLYKKKYKASVIYTDSQLLTYWNKNLKCSPAVNDYERTTELLEQIGRLRYNLKYNLVWIPREENLAGKYIEERHEL